MKNEEKDEAMNEMECWQNQIHLNRCLNCSKQKLIQRLYVARIEERNNEFTRYGEYRTAPVTLKEIVEELNPTQPSK